MHYCRLAVGILVALVLVAGWTGPAPAAPAAPEGAAEKADGGAPLCAIAVFPFGGPSESAAGDGIGLGLAEALTADLFCLPAVMATPPGELVRAARALPGQMAAWPRKDVLALATALGLDYVLTGGFNAAPQPVLTLEALKVDGGRTLWQTRLQGESLPALLQAGSRALLYLAGQLGIPVSETQQKRILGRKTASQAAFRYYAQGVDLAAAACLAPDAAAASAARAADAFRRAVEMDPWYAEAWCHMGWQLNRAGRPDAARDAFAHAQKLKPDLVAAHIGMGDALVQSGRPREGIASLEAGVALNPAIVSHYFPLLAACLAAGDHEKGLHWTAALDSLLAARGRAREQLELLWWSADFYLGLERFDEALAHYNTLLNLLGPSDPDTRRKAQAGIIRIADHYFQAGRRLEQDGRLREAIASFQRALAIDGEHRPKDAGYDYQNIGFCHVRLGEYEQGRAKLEKALELQIRTLGEWHADTATTYNNLGVVCEHLGRYAAARRHFEKALAIRVKSLGDSHVETGVTHSNLGSALRHLGLPQEAVPHYEKALGIKARALGARHAVTGKAHRDLGLALGELGRDAQALAHLEAALAIQVEAAGEAHPDTAAMLGEVGAIHFRMGNAAQALALCERSLAIQRQLAGEGDPSLVPVHEQAARMCESTGDLGQAVEHLGKAVAIQRATLGADHPATAFNYQKLAVLFFRQGDAGLARKYLAKALTIAETRQEIALAWRVLDSLSRLLAESGRPGAAIFFAKRAANLMLSLPVDARRVPVAPVSAGLSPRTGEDALRRLAGLLLEAGRIREAQEVIRRLKSLEYAGFDPLPAAGTDIEPIAFGPLEAAWLERYTYLVRDQAVVEKVWGDFLDDLAAALAEAPPGEASAVSPALEPGMAMVQYLATDERLYMLLAVPRQMPLVKTSDIGAGDLHRQVERLRRDLEAPSRDPRPLAGALYKEIFAPVAAELARFGAHTLLVSLDGPLRYLPLAALYDGRQYLARKYAFVMLAGGAPPAAPAEIEAPREWKLSGFGESPSAREELAGILTAIHGKYFLDADFTAAALASRLAEDPPVVHIASRVHLDPWSLADSFMVLGDGRRLGLKDFPARGQAGEGMDLLAFSALTTALKRRAADGRELEGLGLWARDQGAGAVLATLWPVPEGSTAVFMRHFYRIRRSNPWMSQAEALRVAQVMFMRDRANRHGSAELGPLCHPRYWAPFVLIGDGP